MASRTTAEALKQQGYVPQKVCNDVPAKQAENLGATLKTPEVLTSWILSQYERENRQQILQSMDTPEVHLPSELPYKQLVGSYQLKDQQQDKVKAGCFGCSEKITMWYLHGAKDAMVVKSSKEKERQHDGTKQVIEATWLNDPQKGPVPKDVFTEKFITEWENFIALSYEHEHKGVDVNTDMSDDFFLREAIISPETIEKVVADQYDSVSEVKGLWHDGCLKPSSTGLQADAAVGGILPYISPAATVIKVPCSTGASNGTWLFPRNEKKEEMFISSMISLLGKRNQKHIVMPTGNGKTFKWSGLDGFGPTVKLGGSDRFWLRVELMCGLLRGNVTVGRKAAASVLWSVSWYSTLLKGMKMGMMESQSNASSQVCDLGKALCKGDNIHKPIGICAAAIASLLHLDFKDLFRRITYRLDVVWQQWRLALGLSYVSPSAAFNRALIAPLFGAAIKDKDDVAPVTLFFMYIVHKLESNPSMMSKDRRSQILMEEAYFCLNRQTLHRQPYDALEVILRPTERYELQYTVNPEPDDLKGVLNFKGTRTSDDQQRYNQMQHAWKPVTGGMGFAGILSVSKMKPLLLKHCEAQRLEYLQGLPSDSNEFQLVRDLNPEEELLKVFQHCKRQLLPKDMWLSNEQGLVVLNAYATPTDMIEASIQPEPNNEWLVLPERIEGQNIDELEVYQLVFLVTTESVKQEHEYAHLIAIRKCATADTAIPLSVEDVRDARLAVVDKRLYGKLEIEVKQFLETGAAFHNNGATDFMRLQRDGTLEKPKPAGYIFPSSLPSSKLSSSTGGVPPILEGLTNSDGNLYELAVDRLWKYTWR